MQKPKTAKERRELLFAEVSLAIRKVQLENSKNGIPNVYTINGQMIYQMPDGSIKNKESALNTIVKKKKTLEN